MRKPKDLYVEQQGGRKESGGGGLDNIDKERGHPGKGTGGASVDSKDTGDRSLEDENRGDAAVGNPKSESEKLNTDLRSTKT